ncbi:conserved hypothetical protein [Aspergillus terreus NIH2624]|uniref:Rhodanese domain-containing protein n=2 Tax=Aspergillus terreus TaxID=33178 RepID=Q0CPH6_ASPTN|nr:uncharacterized protein ATEG_04408 [Aspergillus terreus NIH2624]EAU34855.1 conserved hypothetical protein [Aspergillus terreus NIH2624]
MLSSTATTFQRLKSLSCYGLIASSLPLAAATELARAYSHGQPMPVTCLNRTIDSGEHITDSLGKLQYIPFPTCNETFLPLALRYGVTETINCTIASLPDELYHLLEYYVHSDVPMSCRVPTGPLTADGHIPDPFKRRHRGHRAGGSARPGRPARSHLHIWTDMNVLAHNIAAAPATGKTKSKSKGKGKTKVPPGYVVAGTAYSVPEFDVAAMRKIQTGRSDEETAVAEAAREPWTAEHGTKVVRGEPLTFTFHVSWIEGGRGIGWPSAAGEAQGASVGGVFARLFLFVMVGGVGGVLALYWERTRRRGWRGDAILGVPSRGKGSVGISYGNGGKTNGYGYGGTGYGLGLAPPLHAQVLAHLAAPYMEPLLVGLLLDAVGVAGDLEGAQGGGEVGALLRLDVHLAAQRRAQLQLNPPHGRAVVVRAGGHADGAAERERVAEHALPRAAGVAGLLRCGRLRGCGGVADVELAEDLVEVGVATSLIFATYKMSSITIATLPRLSRDALSTMLLASAPSKLAIIDVRDSDHVGGHIYSSTWVPSSSLDYRLPELIRTLQDKEKVVFHCALSQQRGPSAALRYARERERVLGPEESKKQEVYVLEGGFVQWQEKYGKDERLTEAYVEDIWREY